MSTTMGPFGFEPLNRLDIAAFRPYTNVPASSNTDALPLSRLAESSVPKRNMYPGEQTPIRAESA